MSAKYLQVFILSASSGQTAMKNLTAAFEQFPDLEMAEEIHTEIKSPEQVRRVMELAKKKGAIVVHTFVESPLREVVRECAQKLGIVEYDPLGGTIAMLETVTGMRSLQRSGHAHHPLHARKLQALNFVDFHDDGRHPEHLAEADVVLLGLSRAGKTPICRLLADSAVRAANVPIVLGQPLPECLQRVDGVDARRVFVLDVEHDRLIAVRTERLPDLGNHPSAHAYVDPKRVAAEIEYVHEILGRNKRWTRIDVTKRGVEEAASKILGAYLHRFRPMLVTVGS